MSSGRSPGASLGASATGGDAVGAWLLAEGLGRRVRDRDIVREASVAIRAGESVALLGPSGCGKTTLLCMLGLLDEPSAGRLLLGGDDPWKRSASERARLRLSTIGFVFQQNNLLGHLSALENVALPAWRRGAARGERERGGAYEQAIARASALLERFGLSAQRGTLAGVLSTGEAQRVAIARALVNEPRVVLCDEPTGSLDSSAASAVIECLLEVPRGGERGLFVVTHDPNVASRATRTLAMRDGCILK